MALQPPHDRERVYREAVTLRGGLVIPTPSLGEFHRETMHRMFDYLCHRCKQSGSCPIPYGTSALNAVHLIMDAHGSFNLECREKYQGRWMQLGVIERCIKLWSNPGDLVLDPFAGIGSTGYVALQNRRKFLGIELKESYWKVGQEYLKAAESEAVVE